VAYTVHAENYSVIPEAVDTAAGLGVPLRLGLLHPIGRGKQLSPLACEQVMLLVEMAEKARSYGLDVTTNLPPAIDPDSLNRSHNLGACGWGWDLLGIQPDGVVWLCVNTPRVEAARGGSILRRPISDMISERDNGIGRARQLSAQDLKGVCAKCGAAEICGGACRTLALEVYGDLSGPFPTCQRLYDAGVIQPEQIVLESSSA